MSATELLAQQLEVRWGTTATWAEHILDALKAAGVAVVELPKPDDIGGGPVVNEFDAWWGQYPDNDAYQIARWPGGDISTEGDEVNYGGNNYLPEEARAFAAAVLAAADAAEASA